MQEKPVKCYHGMLLLFINLFFSFILLIAYKRKVRSINNPVHAIKFPSNPNKRIVLMISSVMNQIMLLFMIILHYKLIMEWIKFHVIIVFFKAML